MRRAQRPSDPTGSSETSRGRRTTAPATRRVRTKLDDGHEPFDDRTMPGTRQGSAPGIAGDVGETELLERRARLAARMQRDDVIDGDGTTRARRCLEVDRLTAELAAVVGTSPQLRHQPGDVLRPGVTVSPPGSTRNGAAHARIVDLRTLPGDPGELSGRYFWPDGRRVGRALKNGCCLS
jgi:hypothetical protein